MIYKDLDEPLQCETRAFFALTLSYILENQWILPHFPGRQYNLQWKRIAACGRQKTFLPPGTEKGEYLCVRNRK